MTEKSECSLILPFLKSLNHQILLICAAHTRLKALIAVGRFTLNTMWSIMASPLLPGYFPAVFRGDRSNRQAPVSWQTAWTSIFLPTPVGPTSRTDFIRGAFSCTTWEPESDAHIIFNYRCFLSRWCERSVLALIPNGRTAYRDMTCRTSDNDGMGSMSCCLSVVPR